MRSSEDFIKSKVDILTDKNDTRNLDIDYQKLEKYLNFRLTLRNRDNGIETFHKLPFRKCTVDDFERRDLKIDPNQRDALTYKMCPDVNDEIKEIYMILNGYSNRKKRVSFSIDIYKCEENKVFKNTCKSDPEIEELLR